MAHDPFLDAARQYCDADGHTCDPSVVFIGAMYGRRGTGGGRCSEALMRWWTDGTPAGGYSQALDGPVPDNYLVVDTSQTGATASLPDGGGATSWMDAWQGISRPDFFYFDPSLRLIPADRSPIRRIAHGRLLIARVSHRSDLAVDRIDVDRLHGGGRHVLR
jgi:hypothetical protein